MDKERSGSQAGGETAVDVPLEAIPLHSANLLTLLDEDGIIRYESPSIERIFGWDQDDLVGEQVADYFHPDDREAVVDAFRSIVTSDEYTVESVEYRHRQADGTYTWVESVSSADHTPDGFYVVNTRDVSERKERETRLERTNERLESFVSAVSHDLRNPLHVAQTRLELAQEEAESSHLSGVADAHERMASLIEDLLALSTNPQRSPQSGPIDLEALVHASWEMVPSADATLEVDTDRHLEGDRSRVAQLLENLIRNAVEHGRPGVTVTVGDIEDGFYVADDGPGIPPEDRDEIFEAGYSTAPDGNGYGLEIVKRVAADHGWAVSVTESSDGGARFEFTGLDGDH